MHRSAQVATRDSGDLVERVLRDEVGIGWTEPDGDDRGLQLPNPSVESESLARTTIVPLSGSQLP